METSIRSLFVVAPADSDEREIRLRQAEHYAFSAAIKRRRALADEAGASQLAQTLDELKSQQRGRKGPPPLSDMASELDLGALYDDLYRPASIPVHGSLLALADDVTGTRSLDKASELEIPLSRSEPDLSREALALAIVAYAEFLERAEPTVSLGIGERVA